MGKSQSPDYEAIQQAYSENFEEIKKAHDMLARHAQDEEVKSHARRMGFSIPTSLGQLTGEICKDWPMIKQAVSFAFMIGAFIPGISSAFAIVSKVVAMLDTGFIPQVCGSR
jgi:hypothetical protein